MSTVDTSLDFFSKISSNTELASAKLNETLSNEYHRVQALMTDHVNRLAAANRESNFRPTVKHSELLRLLAAHKAGLDPKIHQVCAKLMKDAEGKAGQIAASGASAGAMAAAHAKLYKNVEHTLGKLLYLGNRNAAATLQLLKSAEPTSGIANQFEADCKALVSRLQSLYNADKASGVQDPDFAHSMRLPVEIAKLLLSSDGKINTALIAPLKAFLFPDTKNLLQFEKIIVRVLDSIDATWQPLFDAIGKPTASSCVSSQLIRADLGLSMKSALQDVHAKQAVLAALLAQHCQGPVGDCFAVALSIKLHNEFLQNALQQYGQLVQTGYIERPVNGNPEHFFYKLTLADDDLQKQVSIDADGRINNGPYLWQCPSIASALRQMGLDNPAAHAQTTLNALAANGGQTTPDAIIAAFAKTSLAAYPQRTLEEQIANGRYGFSAVNNRVLRAFETALASMAEARTGDYVHDDMTGAVESALKRTWTSQGHALSAVAGRMQQVFQNTLQSSFRYLFNGAIQCANVSADGSSTAGGFELYQRDLTNDSVPGTRVETPADFQNFIASVITRAAQNMPEADQPAAAKIAQAVTSYVMTNRFMQDVLVAYEPSNGQNPDPVANYAALARTPMTSQDGDNPWELDQIDTGLSFNPNIQQVQPQNCTELLKWVLDLAAWKEQTQHYLESAHPDALDPVTGPDHAFNLAVDEDEIVSFLKSGLSSVDWIAKRFAADAKKCENAVVDNATVQSICSTLEQQLTQVSQEVADQFATWAENLAEQTLTAFAKALEQQIASLLNANSAQKAQIGLMVDQVLFQQLPADLVKPISQNAVRFANTNWDDGAKEIYFCMYYNPRTQSPSFGSIDEDRTNLMPMDETQWVDNQQWDADVSNEESTLHS